MTAAMRVMTRKRSIKSHPPKNPSDERSRESRSNHCRQHQTLYHHRQRRGAAVHAHERDITTVLFHHRHHHPQHERATVIQPTMTVVMEVVGAS
jgi:hypothetical protein